LGQQKSGCVFRKNEEPSRFKIATQGKLVDSVVLMATWPKIETPRFFFKKQGASIKKRGL